PIIHLVARRVFDRSDLLATLRARQGDRAAWDRALARADEVRRPIDRDARFGPPRRALGADPASFLPDSRDFR
ncbi:MAG: hypothetical protein NZ523_02910, partial [Elioraea sp.]|nr:hypothetical protein [Elioraea sp.]